MRSKLVKARIDKGFTQENMANMLGVTRGCYSNYENGIRRPSITKVIQIKKILNDTRDEIFLDDCDTMGVDTV